MSPTPRTPPRPCACTTVRTTSRLLARVYDDALQGTGLNVTQLAVLRAIERMPGTPLSRVAADLSMDRTSVYRSVAKMEEHGWLTTAEGPDARSRCAEIADRGRDVLDAAAPRWEVIQTEVVNRFGRRRFRELVQELGELRTVAESVSSEAPGKGT